MNSDGMWMTTNTGNIDKKQHKHKSMATLSSDTQKTGRHLPSAVLPVVCQTCHVQTQETPGRGGGRVKNNAHKPITSL